MEERSILLTGVWLDTIGQTLAAVASTPGLMKSEEMARKLAGYGSLLQATGTALVVDTMEEESLEKVGIQLQALGNIIAVAGLLTPLSGETKEEIADKGDLIETIGVVIAAPAEIEEGFSLAVFFELFGQMLQVIDIKGVDEEVRGMISEWSQTFAAILGLIDVSRSDFS